MKSFGLVLLLVCAFIVSANSQSTSTSSVKIEVFSGSNPWWIAIQIYDANALVRSVQIRDDRFSWEQMDYVESWGKWTYSARGFEFRYPISFRLYSAAGEQILVNNAVFTVNGYAQLIDSGLQFGGVEVAPSPPTDTETTTSPTTAEPEITTVQPEAPTTTVQPAPPTTTEQPAPPTTTTARPRPPTAAATTRPTELPTTTAAPTTTTLAPTTTTPAPTTTTTQKPAPTTTTAAPTSAPTTQKPVSSGGCGSRMKVMTPLYVYPGAAWDTIINNNNKVESVAIINPASGPGNGPNADYIKYMNKMHAAGVEMIGYVHTTYGQRSLDLVKADIQKYALNFPYVVGIFLDEAAADAGQIPYYRELYNYIMSMPGWKYDVLNPGIICDAGYLSISTQIVTFENYGSEMSRHSKPSYASCANKDQFVAIAHTVGSGSMDSIMDQIKSKDYFGWVYVTDGAGGCCTYNTLTNYYTSEASYMLNKLL